ncbi:sensor histidine kinase [Microbacterium sp. NPDC056044]|uniref:sensor histidine kinase n=1 Tax=Microbacterium sp. NPDC056044 TaxID=3345690 RepID=UPI0035DEDD23
MRRSASQAVVGAPSGADDGLLLPRPPGVFRRFWARHPRFADVIVAVVAFLLSAPTAAIRSNYPVPPTPAQTIFAIVVVVLACLALLFRRSRPVLVFTVTALPLVILPPSLMPATHVVPALAIYAVAVYASVRACWIAFAAATGAMVLYTAVAGLAEPATWGYLVTSLISGAIALLIGALIGINVGNRRRYLEALIDRSRQLLVERDQQARLGAAAERTRIAREMHDIVSHNLTVIVALAEGATATADPARARAVTEQIAGTARGALTEMRAMLGVLRDPDLSPDAPLSPVDAASVADAVESAQRAGFPAVLHVEGRLDDVPAEVRFAVARIVQESLTNAMRHAPLATTIDVRLAVRADAVALDIVNDGVRAGTDAADPAAGAGFGLPGLRERVAHVGGTLTAGAVDGRRWAVRASLPLPARAPEGAEEEEPAS